MQHKRVFKVGFHKFFLVAVPALAMAAVLILEGVNYFKRMRFDPAMWFFYVIPWAMAAVIIIALLAIFLVNVRKSIVITPETFEFRNGGKGFRCTWKNISFTPPSVDKKFLRKALVGDGNRFERIEAFFFPEFDVLMEVLRLAKKRSRETTVTVDIDG